MAFTGRGRVTKRICDEKIPDRFREMAARHADVYDATKLPVFPVPTRTPMQIARESYLEGVRDALEMEHSEIVEENYSLHHTIFQLIAQYGVEPCDACNTEGIDDPVSMTECQKCGGDGWIEREVSDGR